MDSQDGLQDVIRCDICETPVPSKHCDICHIHVCEACEENHLSDQSKAHYFIPFRMRYSFPNCKIHPNNIYTQFCKQCNIPVCRECTFCGEHAQHDIDDILKMLEKNIDRDLQKLEKSVVPKCQEAMSKIEAGKDNVRKTSQKLKTALHKQGEALHKEIDAVIKTTESNIDLMDYKLLAEMNKQEDSMKHIINEIKQLILHLKTLQDTYDICIVSKYESRNEEFSRLPALFQVTLHKFVPRQINSKEIIQQIGLLSEQNIKNLAEWAIEPTVVAKFDTEYKKNALRSVSCQSYTELWTLGWEDCMRLYNLRGELLKSISINSNQTPHDIEVLRNGVLAYTDYHDRSINFVKND